MSNFYCCKFGQVEDIEVIIYLGNMGSLSNSVGEEFKSLTSSYILTNIMAKKLSCRTEQC